MNNTFANFDLNQKQHFSTHINQSLTGEKIFKNEVFSILAKVLLEERHYIEIEYKKGTSQSDIVKALGRDQSNISRELCRNKGLKGYHHKQANNFAQERHKTKEKSIKLTKEIAIIIEGYVREDWSLEQIAGRLSKEDVIDLHHETIYQYILTDKKAGGDLYKHLRHQNKTYRKRYGNARNRTGIPNRVDIDERPQAANNRERVGDWETDTMIGKNHKGAIVTLDDRKSKIRLAFPLFGKKAEPVKDAILMLFKPIQDFVETITFDNGKEFTLHEMLAKELGCDTCFAKPYHSWERGQNENANGLLRQYFPKAMELVDVTIKQVFDAVDKLNSRPRKCLKFKTPYEVFKELTGVDVKKLMGYALMT